MTVYRCAHCSAPAKVEAGVVVRTCACSAKVIADLKAKATGAGGVK
jgi:DNA-directed RNA polymerase subunit RPC12/RpoP